MRTLLGRLIVTPLPSKTHISALLEDTLLTTNLNILSGTAKHYTHDLYLLLSEQLDEDCHLRAISWSRMCPFGSYTVSLVDTWHLCFTKTICMMRTSIYHKCQIKMCACTSTFGTCDHVASLCNDMYVLRGQTAWTFPTWAQSQLSLRLPLSVLLTGQICCVVDGTLMTGNDGRWPITTKLKMSY